MNEEQANFRGTVERISFQNKENGFTVLKASPDPDFKDANIVPGTNTTLVGIVPENISAGSHFIAYGEWQTHSSFGRQFRAHEIHEKKPQGKDAILKYLSSGAIKGIGETYAKRIVDKFGEATLDVLDKDIGQLKKVSGIGVKKLEEIKESWFEKRKAREIFIFFQEYDLSLNLAQKIYSYYGANCLQIVKKNPYLLARDITGIGFQTADRIGQKMGIAHCAKERIEAGLSYTLTRATDDGHCYLPKDNLFRSAERLLNVQDHELFEDALKAALESQHLIQKDQAIYLPTLFKAEELLASDIRERAANNYSAETLIAPEIVNNLAEATSLASEHETRLIKLSDEQKHALLLAASKSMLIITGGPGCGKTTLVRTISQLFNRAGLSLKLAAPTGRAAQRLSEVCGADASTIHRLLKYDAYKREFKLNREEKLDADVVIIDEASMIDLPLAQSLFAALKSSTRIILVGDSDQLPSVGPGRVLWDFLNIEEIPKVCLSTLFRRKEQSLITHVAHQINRGIVPEIPTPDGITKADAYFLHAQNTLEAADLVERLVAEQIPKKFGFSDKDIAVLSPMNKGELGTVALNKRLQERLRPLNDKLPRVKLGEHEFRLGDRVCQRVNNYNLHENGVFNGDQGEIIAIDAENRTIWVKLWDGREIEYKSANLYEISLAYALTIHRSQGSEIPVVVLALHQSHNILLERQLIYTAITRAKKLLIIVGTKQAISMAVTRSHGKKRYTGLADSIRGARQG